MAFHFASSPTRISTFERLVPPKMLTSTSVLPVSVDSTSHGAPYIHLVISGSTGSLKSDCVLISMECEDAISIGCAIPHSCVGDTDFIKRTLPPAA